MWQSPDMTPWRGRDDPAGGPVAIRHGLPWPLGEVAELDPGHDIDARTARLAARIVHELLASARGVAS